MIPEAAVEAAARVAAQGEVEVYDWTEFADYARRLLEAAAPHMLAVAWDEGWDRFAGFDSRPGGPYPANPYRTAK